MAVIGVFPNERYNQTPFVKKYITVTSFTGCFKWIFERLVINKSFKVEYIWIFFKKSVFTMKEDWGGGGG